MKNFIATRFADDLTPRVNLSVQFGSVYAGAGDDTIAVGHQLGAAIYGQSGNDNFSDDESTNSVLYGGEGNDGFAAADFSNTEFHGGEGVDSESVPSGTGGDEDTPGDGIGFYYFLDDDLENMYGVGFGGPMYVVGNASANLLDASIARFPVTLIGDGGDDTLIGGPMNDRFYGNAGNDHLTGSAGSDRLFGGEGNDTLRGGTGVDSLFGEAGTDTLAHPPRRIGRRCGRFDRDCRLRRERA